MNSFTSSSKWSHAVFSVSCSCLSSTLRFVAAKRLITVLLCSAELANLLSTWRNKNRTDFLLIYSTFDLTKRIELLLALPDTSLHNWIPLQLSRILTVPEWPAAASRSLPARAGSKVPDSTQAKAVTCSNPNWVKAKSAVTGRMYISWRNSLYLT